MEGGCARGAGCALRFVTVGSGSVLCVGCGPAVETSGVEGAVFLLVLFIIFTFSPCGFKKILHPWYHVRHVL